MSRKIADIQQMLVNGTLISLNGKNKSVAMGLIANCFRSAGWTIHIQDEQQDELLVEMPETKSLPEPS